MKNIYKIILLLLIFQTSIFGQLAGWQYRRAVAITENSATTLTDYQVKLVVNTQSLIAAGLMNANGDDIRFTKDCSINPVLYNYWIDTGLNTPATVIWVKLDTLLASQTKTIFMYYGNASASAVSAIAGTFIGPHSSTDSVATGGAGGATNSQRGFRFTANEDVLVTHFGKREPNGTPRFITLFDFTTQAKLRQIQVNGPAAQYSYSNLSNPIWLTQGTQYLLEMYQGPTDGYYFGSSSQIGQHFIYGDMRYCNSCTENTFPTNILSNFHYGYPDLWYFTKKTASVLPAFIIAPHGLSGSGSLSISTTATSVCAGSSLVLSSSGQSSYTWSTGSTNDSITVNPISNTTYTLNALDSNACFVSGSIAIAVNQLPTIIASITNDTICPGDSIVLSGSGANFYTWTNGAANGINFAPSISGNYIVTGIDTNGCVNKDTVALVINTLPVVTASASQDTLCAGQSTILIGAGATTYTWNNGATNGVAITPSGTTNYTVTGTDANGCSNAATQSITVNSLPTATANTTSSAVCAGGTVTLTGGGALSYTWNNGVTDGVLFIPASTTTYIVTGTDANTCSDTATITIPVNALPIVTANASINTVCAGDSVTFTGGGAVTYVWDNGATNGVAIIPSGTTNFTVTGTDANSCSDTATVGVTVNPNPVASLTAPVSSPCAGTPITLTGLPGGGTYSVASGNPSALTANVFNAANTGSFSIAYSSTNTFGCTDTAQFTFNVNCVLGLDKSIINNLSLTIFPNPNNGIFIINTSIEIDGTIELINELGQVVYQNRMNGLQMNLDVQNMADGIYHLRLINGKQVLSRTLRIAK